MIELTWINVTLACLCVLVGILFFLYKKVTGSQGFPQMSEENAKMLGEQIKKQIADQQLQAEQQKARMPKRKRADIKINIVVIGNEKCGKTSFLKKLIGPPKKDECPIAEVSNRMEVVRMRKEHIIIDFVDTSEKTNELKEELKDSIIEADFIFMIYDFQSSESYNSIPKKWIPMIRNARNKANLRMPKLAILANKCDNDSTELLEKDQELLKNLDQNISFVAVCSAVTGKNIDQAFEIAHHMVMNPIEPLIDLDNKSLTPKFIMALTEVFQHFDKDKDNVISDDEMKYLSTIVWNEDLKKETLLSIKEVLSRESEQNIVNNGISFVGFCTLMHKYIGNGRRDIPWDMIRDYGYDNEVNKTGVCHFEIEEQKLEQEKKLKEKVQEEKKENEKEEKKENEKDEKIENEKDEKDSKKKRKLG